MHSTDLNGEFAKSTFTLGHRSAIKGGYAGEGVYWHVCLSLRPFVRPACRVHSLPLTVLDGFFPYMAQMITIITGFVDRSKVRVTRVVRKLTELNLTRHPKSLVFYDQLICRDSSPLGHDKECCLFRSYSVKVFNIGVKMYCVDMKE